MKKLNIYSLHTQPDTIHLVLAKQKRVPRRTTLHWHDCCELELVLSGHGTHIINGHHYSIAQGDLYFFTPADCHEIIADEPIEVLGIMLEEEQISEDIFSRLLALEMTDSDLRVSLNENRYQLVERYFSAIIQDESHAGFSFANEYVRRLIDCILIELLREIENTERFGSKDIASEAILYLHRHYTEPITLQSLSNHLHLNPSYLSTYFKDTIGRNFKDYLTELRLRHARRLLINTELSISDVCYRCGFTSYSNFMRTFRKHYQNTPMQFRREHQSERNRYATNI